MQEFLAASDVVDCDHAEIRARAAALATSRNVHDIARECFEFVRDEIAHSRDFRRDPATVRASDVLRHGTGYCYAKSHLLVALLRANGIPAGFCYQRLSQGDSGPPYSLHGYVAIRLPEIGWYRADPRGNKPGVDARFEPPHERLAFPLQSADEYDFETIYPQPLECVIEALQQCDGWKSVLENLPDVVPADFARLGLQVRRQGGV